MIRETSSDGRLPWPRRCGGSKKKHPVILLSTRRVGGRRYPWQIVDFGRGGGQTPADHPLITVAHILRVFVGHGLFATLMNIYNASQGGNPQGCDAFVDLQYVHR